MTDMTQTPDRIENVVEINAPLDRVWALVSTPGWWLGDGPDDIQDPPAAARERCPVEEVESQPQDYCSFRWAPTTPGAPPADDNSTLIEFFVTEDNGMVTVRVVESGFAALSADDETHAAGRCDNTTMTTLALTDWQDQLGYLREAAQTA